MNPRRLNRVLAEHAYLNLDHPDGRDRLRRAIGAADSDDLADPSSRILIPLQEAPAVITRSARSVLAAHGLRVMNRREEDLSEAEVDDLLVELGRNISQALVVLDELEDEEVPGV